MASNSASAQPKINSSKALRKRHWSIWLSRFALLLGIIVVATALIGAIGAGARWWDQRTGILALTAAAFLAIAVFLYAVLVLIYYRKEGARIWLASLAALVFSGGYLAYIGTQIPKAQANPLHDVSTNLGNPPKFIELPIRSNNFSDIPGRGESEYAGMDATERWRTIHANIYPDLKTLRLFQPVGLVIQRAEEIAQKNGWSVATADPINGRLEATDEVALQKFQDDIVLRAIPDGDGEGSLVDIRSRSRFGQSDLGVNARRIRRFSNELLEQLGGEVRSGERTSD